ncbi:LysR family transcriptional regulator [Roseibium sp. Sym1]|uniref:LysR family transcriptional regulator n=1 Tax=Roseibium sp. Sym1 TaxID=3016006 RepID=UPI0022B3682D|nr:LysR family transcriptional regulator [Roseibium sp. Sym1]
MDSDLLKAFVTVADTGGFSAAAKLLNRTQSAVSLQIKRLEEHLGTRLFTRTSRTVALTPGGTRLLPFARQLLSLQQDARTALNRDTPLERIRFGLTEEHAAAYLPILLAKLARTHPEVQVEVVCDISSTLVEQFREGKLDLVLAVRHQPTRTGRVLGVEPMIWVAHETFDLGDGMDLPLALNPDGCIFRAHALAAVGRTGRPWREPYVSQSPTGVNVPVQAGLAITVKTPRSIPSGCCDIGSRFGLPALGLAEIELHVSPARISDAFQDLVRLVETHCRAGQAGKRPAEGHVASGA